ncbi:MAG: hypothetical protein Q9220_002753 [cf. Caloplaca sp. 1 TL-2023]
MTDSSVVSDPSNSDHKSWSRHHWRAKLSRKDGKALKGGDAQEQEVQDFLHAPPTADTAQANPSPEPQQRAVQPQHNSSRSNNPSPETTRKLPRRSGFRVTFSTEAPIVIGEGGDQALLPAAAISSTFRSIIRPATDVFVDPADLVEQKGLINKVESSPLRHLQRRPTGLQLDEPIETYATNTEPLGNSQRSQAEVVGLSSTQHQKSLKDRDSAPDPAPGQTHQPSIDALQIHNGNTANTGYRRSQSRHETSVVPASLLYPATPLSNSLTPSPSPRPSLRTSRSSENGFPFPSASNDDKLRAIPPQSSHPKSNQDSHPQEKHPDNAGEGPNLTVSDDAERSADDAIHDFAVRVQSFCSIFLLGIDARARATLYQWILAATWWFLQGRNVLESLVRSSVKNLAAHEITTPGSSTVLKQAYVNLAKTWFIIFEMIPDRYPEVRRSENGVRMPNKSIIRPLDSTQSTELLWAYSSIRSNLRSLVTSMKKNDKMPPIGFELQGSDVRIFLAYPPLPPDVVRLLNSERSTTNDKASLGLESCFPWPISDTGRHFNYGRMFVNVILNHQNVGSANSIPCLLSILRDRRDRDVTVLLASQDGKVHLAIQPDDDRYISWRNVRWNTAERCIQLEINECFTLQIEFDERDFKTIWGINDYIHFVDLMARRSRNESLLIETGLKSFQIFNQDRSSTRFPIAPVEKCLLRLFECFQVSTEGLYKSKIHDGYRLMIVTPTQIKTLNYVNQRLGKQQPILYGFLRNEDGGAALLLNSSKSSRAPYMVMSFYEEAERRVLYSQLSGNAKSNEEDCSGPLNMAKITVSTISREEEQGSWTGDGGPLDSLMWNRFEIFRQQSTEIQHDGSLIRISAECNLGSLIDRINLGI